MSRAKLTCDQSSRYLKRNVKSAFPADVDTVPALDAMKAQIAPVPTDAVSAAPPMYFVVNFTRLNIECPIFIVEDCVDGVTSSLMITNRSVLDRNIGAVKSGPPMITPFTVGVVPFDALS